MQDVNLLFSHINYRLILKSIFARFFFIDTKRFTLHSFHFFVLLQMQNDYGFLSTTILDFGSVKMDRLNEVKIFDDYLYI